MVKNADINSTSIPKIYMASAFGQAFISMPVNLFKLRIDLRAKKTNTPTNTNKASISKEPIKKL